MLKIRVLLFLLINILIILYSLQPCECVATFFQEYRKKRQKIREKRLKLSTAEVRLEELRRQDLRRARSEQNADQHGVKQDHSNRSRWR